MDSQLTQGLSLTVETGMDVEKLASHVSLHASKTSWIRCNALITLKSTTVKGLVVSCEGALTLDQVFLFSAYIPERS
jgi:hypothetical protein